MAPGARAGWPGLLLIAVLPGAINKMMMILGLHLSLPPGSTDADRPVVFVGVGTLPTSLPPFTLIGPLHAEMRPYCGGDSSALS